MKTESRNFGFHPSAFILVFSRLACTFLTILESVARGLRV
jgi:hypothetical protein